jgi:hypothetical protein
MELVKDSMQSTLSNEVSSKHGDAGAKRLGISQAS